MVVSSTGDSVDDPTAVAIVTDEAGKTLYMLVFDALPRPHGILGKAAFELVCFCTGGASQTVGPTKRSWSTGHCDALESFRTGLEDDSKAALGKRCAACFKLLEGLSCTINTLMGEEPEDSSKAENATTPLDAEQGATSDVVAASHPLPVV